MGKMAEVMKRIKSKLWDQGMGVFLNILMWACIFLVFLGAVVLSLIGTATLLSASGQPVMLMSGIAQLFLAAISWIFIYEILRELPLGSTWPPVTEVSSRIVLHMKGFLRKIRISWRVLRYANGHEVFLEVRSQQPSTPKEPTPPTYARGVISSSAAPPPTPTGKSGYYHTGFTPYFVVPPPSLSISPPSGMTFARFNEVILAVLNKKVPVTCYKTKFDASSRSILYCFFCIYEGIREEFIVCPERQMLLKPFNWMLDSNGMDIFMGMETMNRSARWRSEN
jgi:hypothetical protein